MQGKTLPALCWYEKIDLIRPKTDQQIQSSLQLRCPLIHIFGWISSPEVPFQEHNLIPELLEPQTKRSKRPTVPTQETPGPVEVLISFYLGCASGDYDSQMDRKETFKMIIFMPKNAYMFIMSKTCLRSTYKYVSVYLNKFICHGFGPDMPFGQATTEAFVTLLKGSTFLRLKSVTKSNSAGDTKPCALLHAKDLFFPLSSLYYIDVILHTYSMRVPFFSASFYRHATSAHIHHFHFNFVAAESVRNDPALPCFVCIHALEIFRTKGHRKRQHRRASCKVLRLGDIYVK